MMTACSCGRRYYDDDQHTSCYECFLGRRAGHVECIYCGRWHSPDFDTCFGCRSGGRDEAAHALKLMILARDSFACRYCGLRQGEAQVDPRKISGEDDGWYPVVLQIDHVKPCRAGGTADPWNLQTLCAVCNAAKGGDWLDVASRHSLARQELVDAYATYLWEYLTSSEQERLLGEVDRGAAAIRTLERYRKLVAISRHRRETRREEEPGPERYAPPAGPG